MRPLEVNALKSLIDDCRRAFHARRLLLALAGSIRDRRTRACAFRAAILRVGSKAEETRFDCEPSEGRRCKAITCERDRMVLIHVSTRGIVRVFFSWLPTQQHIVVNASAVATGAQAPTYCVFETRLLGRRHTRDVWRPAPAAGLTGGCPTRLLGPCRTRVLYRPAPAARLTVSRRLPKRK